MLRCIEENHAVARLQGCYLVTVHLGDEQQLQEALHG